MEYLDSWNWNVAFTRTFTYSEFHSFLPQQKDRFEQNVDQCFGFFPEWRKKWWEFTDLSFCDAVCCFISAERNHKRKKPFDVKDRKSTELQESCSGTLLAFVTDVLRGFNVALEHSLYVSRAVILEWLNAVLKAFDCISETKQTRNIKYPSRAWSESHFFMFFSCIAVLSLFLEQNVPFSLCIWRSLRTEGSFYCWPSGSSTQTFRLLGKQNWDQALWAAFIAEVYLAAQNHFLLTVQLFHNSSCFSNEILCYLQRKLDCWSVMIASPTPVNPLLPRALWKSWRQTLICREQTTNCALVRERGWKMLRSCGF